MKKLLSLALSMAMVLGLTACGGSSGSGGSGGSGGRSRPLVPLTPPTSRLHCPV